MDEELGAEAMRYLEQAEGPLAYLALALSAAIEPIFPPYPGDAVSMFGAFLCFTASYHLVAAYVATTAGSLAGGMVVYEAGAWMGRHREGWPRFLRGPRTERAITRVLGLFERHGGALMAINRFWPALRAVFFLAAGMARRPRAEVAFYGGISSAAWHGFIFVIGWQAGERFDAVLDFFQRYTIVAWVAVAVLLALVGARWLWRRTRRS